MNSFLNLIFNTIFVIKLLYFDNIRFGLRWFQFLMFTQNVIQIFDSVSYQLRLNINVKCVYKFYHNLLYLRLSYLFYCYYYYYLHVIFPFTGLTRLINSIRSVCAYSFRIVYIMYFLHPLRPRNYCETYIPSAIYGF